MVSWSLTDKQKSHLDDRPNPKLNAGRLRPIQCKNNFFYRVVPAEEDEHCVMTVTRRLYATSLNNLGNAIGRDGRLIRPGRFSGPILLQAVAARYLVVSRESLLKNPAGYSVHRSSEQLDSRERTNLPNWRAVTKPANSGPHRRCVAQSGKQSRHSRQHSICKWCPSSFLDDITCSVR